VEQQIRKYFDTLVHCGWAGNVCGLNPCVCISIHVPLIVFVVSEKGQSSPRDMEQMKPLLQMVFHCIDKMKRFKLTKEVGT